MDTIYEFLSRWILKMGITSRKTYLERKIDGRYRSCISQELDAISVLEDRLNDLKR